MKDQIRILLVEDNKHDQYFFTHAIREIEHATLYHIANNGQEALNKLADPGILPDLIFTDINMPVMDGIECLSQILKNPEIKHIPVIVLSGDKKQIPIVRALGAKAFIEKPSDYSMLRKQIEHIISIYFVAQGQVSEKFQTLLSTF